MSKEEKPFQLEQVSIRLVKDAVFYSDTPINSPRMVAEVMGKCVGDMDREVMCVINVNVKCIPINFCIVSMGTIDQCIGSPKDLFKAAILSNATGIILLHNHPSNELTPSEEDIKLTRRMEQACQLMDIDLLDHIIIGTDGCSYFSFCEQGFIDKSPGPTICAGAEKRAR